ncbi:hypothetical protein Hdeb2414_s0022g00611921 [Helianthus debilis subsp. tardiflorus]
MKKREKTGGPIDYPAVRVIIQSVRYSGRFVYQLVSRLRFSSGLGYGVSGSSHSCGSGSGWSPARRGADDGFPTGHAGVDICVWLGSVTNSTCYSFQISVRVFGLAGSSFSGSDSGGRWFKLFLDLVQTSIRNFSARVSSFGSTVLVRSSGRLSQTESTRSNIVNTVS